MTPSACFRRFLRTEDMDAASATHRLGDYLLKQRIAEGPAIDVWLGEQVSITRPVLIHELRAERLDGRESFLADARAKAGVDHPLVASVYEAVDEAERCFFVVEQLPGSTFAVRRDARLTLQPENLVRWLGRIAEANLQLETRGLAAAPLTLESIHVDEKSGLIRLANLAVSGVRDEGASARDIVCLGESLVPLVATGRPGGTRVLTLLSWMRGEGLAAPLTWGQVHDYCGRIEEQLRAAAVQVPVVRPKDRALLVALAAVAAIGVIMVAAFLMRSRTEVVVVPERLPLPEAVVIPAGQHPAPDGGSGQLPAFGIAAHEVTIGEYAAFLQTLAVLAASGREASFDEQDQPAEKVSHEPTDWASLFAAAEVGGTWQGLAVTLDSPVVGVDWWDAAAFARWRQARLPTQDEWVAALHHGGGEGFSPADLPAGEWQAVTAATADVTAAGLIGMAGSVAEWTRLPAANPANPLGPRRWVIIGGSHFRPGNGALNREWTDDRSLRRADLGFRLVFPSGS